MLGSVQSSHRGQVGLPKIGRVKSRSVGGWVARSESVWSWW